MKYSMFVAILGMIFMTGCGKVVPPGEKVIIVKTDGSTKIIEQGVYKAFGRDRAYFVDGKLNSFTENMLILCADEINMNVDIKSVMSFKVDSASVDFIKEKVPTQRVDTGEDVGMKLSLDKFYTMAVKDLVRTSGRSIISEYETENIRPNREKIESDVFKLVQERVKQLKYPINISAILISNLDYPDAIKEQRNEMKRVKLDEEKRDAQARADLAHAKRQVEVAMEEAKVKLVKAQAEADENKILGEALTPQFLLWRQYEVMEKMAAELEAGSVFIVPYEAVGKDLLNTSMISSQMQPKPKAQETVETTKEVKK